MKAKWWKETVFYEIYMPSFNDSNGDGIGDFAGITQKLDYLEQLGINGIWLTPFYKSPKVDNGYDISDYCAIDDDYGTMKDFEHFIVAAHQRDIKVVIDMVLNHTSSEHPWFRESRKATDNPYRDYYIWTEKPNNWESFFSGSAWEYDDETKQYYYHKFAREQADLNWANPRIMAEAKKIFKFWLDKGVDAFRFDVINFLTCAGITSDNPGEGGKQVHKFDINQQGIMETLSELCGYVRSLGDNFLVGEVGSDQLEILKRYQNLESLDVVFNFNLGSKKSFSSAEIFHELVEMNKSMPGLPTIFFSSHDMSRHISRFGEGTRDVGRAKAIATLMMTAVGVPFMFAGEEIGMTDLIASSLEEMNDIQGITNYKTAIAHGKSHAEALAIANEASRDKSRSPMQWDFTENAGFTTGKPWLRINDNYKQVNVEKELQNENSLLNHYLKLIKLRKTEDALSHGKYLNLSCKDGLLRFTRSYHGSSIMVYISFDKQVEIDLPAGAFKVLHGKPERTLAKNETLILKI